jgi:predicted ATPase/DNA-binding winged helix-turn-helix (wHTH) protein
MSTINRRPHAAHAPPIAAIVTFGPFRLHVEQRKLEKNGRPVQLRSRAFDILVAMIEEAGTVISKERLISKVWPGATADYNNLRVHMTALRKILGDGKDGEKYLSTISGQGYCFVADVRASPDSIPSVSTPTRTLAHNLPARGHVVVGHDRAIHEISQLLTKKRFVTIIGSGGIGKTTVAISVGYALLTAFEGRVHFIDFGAIRDTALIWSIIATALGLPAQSPSPVDVLIEFMRSRPTLLILDCCEHVIDNVAVLAEQICQGTEQAHILATSREMLRVEGENVYRLPHLACPPEGLPVTAASALAFPAVQLLVQCASAHGSRFKLTDSNAPEIGNICRRLDGVALAIELAAGRINESGVEAISEIDNQLSLSWDVGRTAPPRHRTLRATIEWSYNLLSASEQLVLARLSVFFGNFTLEAARSVARSGDSEDDSMKTDLILGRLVDKSMLALSLSYPSNRYRLLETTRSYLQQTLSATTNVELIATRHASYFVEFLEALKDKPDKDFSLIADQFGNIGGALAWCFSEHGNREIGVALTKAAAPFFFHFSLLTEGQLWITRAIEAMDATDVDKRSDIALHTALGSALLLTGQFDKALPYLDEALKHAENSDDTSSQLHLIDRLHLLNVFAGRIDDALDIAKKGEVIAATTGEPTSLARMRVSVSISYHYLGEVTASRSYIEAAISKSASLDADVCYPLTFDFPRRAQITRARILWLQGFSEQAMAISRGSLSDVMAMDCNPLKLSRTILWARAVFAWNSEEGDYDVYADRLIEEARKHGIPAQQLVGEAMKGAASIARGELASGSKLLRRSAVEIRSQSYGPAADLFSIQLAEVLMSTGESKEALGLIKGTIARANSCNYLLDISDLLRVKAEVLLSMRTPDYAEAEQCLKQSLGYALHQGALTFELKAATSLARVWLRQGRRQDAHGLLAPIYARFSEGFNSRILTEARELLETLM